MFITSTITRFGLQLNQTKMIHVHNTQPGVVTGLLARNVSKALTGSTPGEVALNTDFF